MLEHAPNISAVASLSPGAFCHSRAGNCAMPCFRRTVFALVCMPTLLEPFAAFSQTRTKTPTSRTNQIIETCHLREIHTRPYAQCVATQSSALRELMKLMDGPESQNIKRRLEFCMATTKRPEGYDYVETLNCLAG